MPRPGAVPPPFVGVSPAVKRALRIAEQFSTTRMPILIVGATGTGKELLAHWIHWRSGRLGELVDVNCGALPREMIESLLFGHVKGAFTGATEAKSGLFALAHGTTLLLDEILSLPFESQATLLRVLETGEVRPLGATQKRYVDTRVLATAQMDLRDRMAHGLFRRDLYHRLSGAVIELLPLVERPEDIEPLAVHFASFRARTLGAGAERVLRRHSWPGNARELRDTVDRACELADGASLPASALADAIELGGGGCDEARVESAVQTRYEIVKLCEDHGWHAGRTAAWLGIDRVTLYRRLKAMGISLRERKKRCVLLQARCATIGSNETNSSLHGGLSS